MAARVASSCPGSFSARDGDRPPFVGKLEDVICRLYTSLGFQDPQEIERAQLHDALAVAYGDALQNGCFFTEQYATFLAQQTVRFFDDLYGGAFAQIGLPKVWNRGTRGIEYLVGLGRRDLDSRAMRFHPIEDILCAQTGCIERCFMQNSIRNDDIGGDVEQIVEHIRGR